MQSYKWKMIIMMILQLKINKQLNNRGVEHGIFIEFKISNKKNSKKMLIINKQQN